MFADNFFLAKAKKFLAKVIEKDNPAFFVPTYNDRVCRLNKPTILGIAFLEQGYLFIECLLQVDKRARKRPDFIAGRTFADMVLHVA